MAIIIPCTLKFLQGFVSCNCETAGSAKYHVFNFCKNVACLVLRPVAVKFVCFSFSRMQTNAKINPLQKVQYARWNFFLVQVQAKQSSCLGTTHDCCGGTLVEGTVHK